MPDKWSKKLKSVEDTETGKTEYFIDGEKTSRYLFEYTKKTAVVVESEETIIKRLTIEQHMKVSGFKTQ